MESIVVELVGDKIRLTFIDTLVEMDTTTAAALGTALSDMATSSDSGDPESFSVVDCSGEML